MLWQTTAAARRAPAVSTVTFVPQEEVSNFFLVNPLAGVDAQPRPYQQRIIEKACRMFAGEYQNPRGDLETAASSVLIESPTGSGKTVMGLAIARWMQAVYGYRIGWVAMRRNLLSQAARENHDRGFDVEMQTISMFEKRPPQVDMLIVDEAQHDAAMSMANLHCAVQPKVVLGLTATPYRADRVKLCFDKVIKDCGIHQLIQDGYLSRYHHYTLPEYTPESVAQFYLADQQRWGKSLIFFHREEQCIACRDLLAAGGVKVDIVTGRSNRQRQLADFEAGKTDVLINMNVLTEGFDCPQLRTVFCRPSGKSCTVQMGGRAFRQHPSEPIKQIVQCKATRHPFIKTAMAEQQFVWSGDQWRTLQVNDRISQISDRTRQLIAGAKVELPKLVAANRQRTLPWQRAWAED